MIQATTEKQTIRCAIYTRKSHEEGLDQDFNSLDAQREAAESFIASQRHEGWEALPANYTDGGFTGANTDRPGLQKLMADIERGGIDCVVVYKVDRLSRSLLDFAKLIAVFDEHEISFVSVTQQFNTSTSMGRLTLNVLLSFAQFEREIIGERIRDKKLASAMKGKYLGGHPILGYDVDREKMRLLANPEEAELVRWIFRRFAELKSSLKVARELSAQGHRTKAWTTKKDRSMGGKRWNKVYVYRVVTNRKYIGEVVHKGTAYPGEHDGIVDRKAWDKAHRIIAENSHSRAMKTRRKTSALLTGVLRCGHCGKAMGASHTKRRGKRYRYYVCNNAERNGYDACLVKSVAAGQIEAAVIEQLRRVFRSPDVIAQTFRTAQEQAEQQVQEQSQQKERFTRRLRELRKAIGKLVQAGDDGDGALSEELRTLNEEYAEVEGQIREVDAGIAALHDGGPTEDEVRDALQKLDPVWDELFPAERERIVKLLVKEAAVSADGLDIRLHTNGLRSLVAELRDGQQAEVGEDGNTLSIHVPMEFHRRGGRKEIILPPDAHTTADVSPRRPIVVALARAYKWQEMLDTGEVGSLDELAAVYGVDRSYAGRILKLSTLAPDIVQRIVAGSEPNGLSLEILRKCVLLRWDKQRSRLKLTASGN